MRLTFLVQDAFAVGGTPHAVFNLANVLAPAHHVQVVSVLGSHTAAPARRRCPKEWQSSGSLTWWRSPCPRMRGLGRPR